MIGRPAELHEALCCTVPLVEQARILQVQGDVRSSHEGLTSREREVMALVTAGLMNKQVAGRLGLSEITVKIHCGNMMRKMQAQSLANLVRMAESLGARETSVHHYPSQS